MPRTDVYFYLELDKKNVVILAHGLTKEGEVPNADIERARRRKEAFEKSPQVHLYEETDGKEDS